MHMIAKASLLLGTLGAGSALAAKDEAATILDGLQRGKWVLTPRDGTAARSLCLGDTSQLVQIRHRGNTCNSYVVETSANRIAVQYTCKGSGYGRTSIRQETPTLLQIESQGIKDGRPFQFRAEARRTGACR